MCHWSLASQCSQKRVRKAEKVATHLEETREELKKIADKEKLDLHYNMGVIYTERGMYKEAKNEYLRALRLDPADADVHYNLAILYDDNLSDKKKAFKHYKKYVQLNPYATDVDIVRSWLLDIELSLR